MKLDLNKIINIKKISDIKKYDTTKPLYNTNYLFHYLIITKNLKGLKLAKFPVHIENHDAMNAFHLAAKETTIDDCEILEYLLDTYPEYVYNRNKRKEAFTFYLSFHAIPIIVKKFKHLDWDDLLNFGSMKEYMIIKHVLQYDNYFELEMLLKNYKMKIINNNQLLFFIIYNTVLTSKQKIDLLDNFTEEEINIKNSHNEGLIFKVIELQDVTLFNYLIKRNIDLNYHCNTGYPIYKTLYQDISTNNFTNTLTIYNKIKNEQFYNQTDKFMNNILNKIFQIRLTINKQTKDLDYSFDYEIMKHSNSDDWNQRNVYDYSPFDYIVQLDFDIYKKHINNIIIDINININIMNRIKKHASKQWIGLLLKFKTIKMPKYIDKTKYTHATVFQSKFTDASIFSLYLIDKHPNLYLPNITSYMLNNKYIDYDAGYPFADDMIMKNPIFPWIINYYSDKEFYIHPYLNNQINSAINDKKKRFACVFISVITDTFLHANVLVYDFKNKTVERFEPYGNLIGLDTTIDNVLEEELTWNTGLKYICPKDYLPHASFQMISDENNPHNKKPGDFGGFCLAWCIWYVENRILNPDINPKVLIIKLINKIKLLKNRPNIKFVDYIRNYANKINKKKIKYMKKIGIDKHITSNLHLTHTNDHKIIKFIKEKYSHGL